MSNNVFRITVNDGMYLVKKDIEDIQIHKNKFTNGKKYCVLFICPEFGNLSKEAREYLAQPCTNHNAIAKAIIAPNLGIRLLADFFISFNKPPVKHKIFTKIDRAYEWMNAQFDAPRKTDLA